MRRMGTMPWGLSLDILWARWGYSMGGWGFWDWLAYGSLGLSTFFLAANAAITSLDALREALPRFLKHHYWGFVPFAFFCLASAIFVSRQLGWLPASTSTPLSQNVREGAGALHARLVVLRLRRAVDDRQVENVITANIGKTAAIGLSHTGKMIFNQGPMAEREIANQFREMIAGLEARDDSGTSQIISRQEFWWSFSSPVPTASQLAGWHRGYFDRYIFLIMRYRDRSLLPGKWWLQEVCFIQLPNGSLAECSDHNIRTVTD